MPKKRLKRDANEIAFNGLQELLKRDEERDRSRTKDQKLVSITKQIKKPQLKKSETIKVSR
jgi:hypothetical protein